MESMARALDLPAETRLATELAAFLEGDAAEAVLVTVPDRYHKDVAVPCFEAGKHVMLEKPMALTADDCRAILRAHEKARRVLQIGFVLRCTPFYRRIKEVVSGGRLGQVMGIQAAEHLGLSHSSAYMRRWHRQRANSGSFLLTKCSHDLDLLSWLTGSRPSAVASFGDNNFFLPDKQPAEYCSACPVRETCPYRFDGGFVYMTDEEKADPSKCGFDRCVYTPDKDIVDNQVCILEFANGVRATFALQLFHPRGGRSIAISGTEGFLSGWMEDHRVRVEFNDGRPPETHDLTAEVAGGHGGGDARFVDEFVEAVRAGTEPVTDLLAGLASTVVGAAIEEARARRKVVRIPPSHYEF
jgi:predicted dehydrogenase